MAAQYRTHRHLTATTRDNRILGIVPRLPGPRWDDRSLVVISELLIPRVNDPLPVALAPHMRRGRRVVGDDDLRHAPVERERAHVRVKPRLRPHVGIGPAEQ